VLPADAAVFVDGREVGFCSESCAVSWAGGERPLSEPVGEA